MFSLIPLLATVYAPSFSFDFVRSPIADLTYELDNLSGMMPWEASGSYRILWEREFLKTKEDSDMLELWKNTRRSIEPPRVALESGFPIQYVGPQADREAEVRNAGFLADSTSTYRATMKALAKPDQVSNLVKVLEHFKPTFDKWWKLNADPKGDIFASKLKDLIANPTISAHIESFARFYEVPREKTQNLPIVFLYKPSFKSENTSGQQLGRVAIVQFLAGESPKDRVDVVLHEFCHYLYASSPKKVHVQAQKQFIDHGMAGIAAFQLLDEAMASCFGNGLVRRELMQPANFEKYLSSSRSFYSDFDIDLSAKAAFKIIEPLLKANRSLRSKEFIDGYVGALKEAFGDSIDAPRRFLKDRYLFVDSSVPDAAMQTRQILRPASQMGYSGESIGKSIQDFQLIPGANGIIVVDAAGLKRLLDQKIVSQEDHEKLAASKQGGILISQKGKLALQCLIYATNPEDLVARLKQLEQLKSLQTGVLLP